MIRVEIKAAAENDLRDIARYIAQDNPSRAVSYVRELRAKVLSLGERPMSFPARIDWGAELRSALHGKYVIVFRASADEVVVLRIIHGARDIAALF